jgi:N-acetylmuramoyl-L-alanine amidase
MKILGPPSASYDTVLARLRARGGVHERFINDMVPALWAAALKYGIDPVGMVAQSGKETAWGNFGGKVPWQFYNTAGNKINPAVQGLYPGITDGDNPLAHAQFANWKVGAECHAQHLRRYAGVPIQVETLLVAPRYYAVIQANTGITEWAELSGKWAPAASYGPTLESIIISLR